MTHSAAMPARDVEASARALLAERGGEAMFHAAEMANRSYAKGDRSTGRYWVQVAWAVQEAAGRN